MLTLEHASDVLAFARRNKARLLEELGEPVGLPLRLCQGCGKPFTPSRHAVVYCSHRCFSTCSCMLQ